MPIGVPRVRAHRSDPKKRFERKKFERKKNQKGEKGFLNKVINFDKSEVDKKEVDEKEVDEAGYEGEVDEKEVDEAGYEGEVDEEEVDEAGYEGEVDEAGSVDVHKVRKVKVHKVRKVKVHKHEAGSGEEEEDEFDPGKDDYYPQFGSEPYIKPRIKVHPFREGVSAPHQADDDRLKKAGWIDLYEQLSRDGYIFLFGKLTKRLTNTIISLILFLNMQDPTREQFLWINSRGGKIQHALALYETIGAIRTDVGTIGLGVAASMGAFILSGGTLTKRLAFPHVWRQ